LGKKGRAVNTSQGRSNKDEIKELKGVSKEHLKAVHDIKKTFKGAKVEECKKKL